jgi:predicted transcriptional regulator YheO
MDGLTMDFLKRLAKGLAAHFGANCEVAVHGMTLEDTILAIENGHVTGRKVGDGPSQVVLEALQAGGARMEDRIAYLTSAPDGRILKSSTIFIRDEGDATTGMLSINYDISNLMAAEQAIGALISHAPAGEGAQTPQIPNNVNDLLFALIEQSVKYAGGKPPRMMTKAEKKRAIQFLSDAGAFLITKSGDHVSNYFGISKFTLYSYIDAKNQEKEENDGND